MAENWRDRPKKDRENWRRAEGETVSNALDAASAYVGKRDRVKYDRSQDEYFIQNLSNQGKGIMEYHREVLEVDDLNKIDASRALNIYLNIRYLRHEIWSEFLADNKTDATFRFNDIKFSDFCHVLRGRGMLDKEPTPDIANKTPDIAILVEGRYVVLGDISVSTVVNQANKNKTAKYLPLIKFLQDNDIDVKNMNFIIDHELKDTNYTVQRFIDQGIIDENKRGLKTTKYLHELSTNIMSKLKLYNDNHELFNMMLANNDDITQVDYEDIDIDLDVDMEPDTTTLTEEELAQMVKEVVDPMYEDYFDKDFQKTEENFAKLIESFKDRDHMKPKSTLQVVSNNRDVEVKSGHELLIDYIVDLRSNLDPISQAIINFLPTEKQAELMKDFQKTRSNTMENDEAKFECTEHKVYGRWQYTRGTKHTDNLQTAIWNSHLRKGKKNPNEKDKPKTIDPDLYDECILDMDTYMLELGQQSLKPSPLKDEWDATTQFEHENTANMRNMYNYVRQTQAIQMSQAMSMFYQRLVHITTKESSKDNIYVANNGSMIAIVPREHQLITQANVDVPFICLTRYKKENSPKINNVEYEMRVETDNYIYLISKLSRMNMTKLAHWEHAAERITATCAHLISQSEALYRVKEKVVGVVTYLSLDLHQKTSEFLDLLKYIAYMPFADCTRLSKLVETKMDIMLKTKLDVWVLFNIKDFMTRLSVLGNVTATKSKIRMYNGVIQDESLGMNVKIPSFINKTDKHLSLTTFIEEAQMLFAVRGKQFYGKQYLDQSTTKTARYNHEYSLEVEKYGTWATEGHGPGKYPFEAEFTFCKDAILHAQKHFFEEFNIKASDVQRELHKIDYNTYIHHLTSLRGSVKEIIYRRNKEDVHTTALDAALTYYKSVNYDEKKCTTIYMAVESLKDKTLRVQYFMSEKEQRGGGRPIATGTLRQRINNAMVEKPEQAIGKFTPNNIVVSGKHKPVEQSKAYINLISQAANRGFKFVGQCTEDQMQFSEKDNVRKYEYWIRNNKLLPLNVRKLQLVALRTNNRREHLVKRIPTKILETPEYAKYINEDKTGIICNIGWPQGMYNNLSTSVHCAADIWIVKLFRIAYPDKPVISQGLVHSDDSCYTLACDSIETFRLFAVFRIMAKRLFTLKSNDKKIWASSILGEIVSNYNLNGNVMVSIIKPLINAFNNVMHHSWVTDVNNQISTLQQLYRNGASLSVITLMATILRQQIFSSYNIKEDQRKDIHTYPIELGGYPDSSPFELAVSGAGSHYKRLLDMCMMNPTSKQSIIIMKAIKLSQIYSSDKEIKHTKLMNEQDRKLNTSMPKTNMNKNMQENEDGLDYESVMIPNRADAFTCVRHIMPKPKKISKTIESLKDLPFESEGVEFLVTRPVKLSNALGNLKAQTSTLLYNLAADKYTSSKKRMAMSQSIQATGKTVRICNHKPTTMLEARELIYHTDVEPASIMQLQVAFEDDTNVINHCEMIVNNASYHVKNSDKRKVANTMPIVKHNFNTVAELRQVLLYIIDKELGTTYWKDNTFVQEPIDILETDARMIKHNFRILFSYFNVKQACNTIMKIKMANTKTRYWLQPKLSNSSIETFLESLYGKTLSDDVNYHVTIDLKETRDQLTSSIINTMYTIEVINSMYDNQFKMKKFDGKSVHEALEEINYSKLSDQDFLKYSVLRYIYFGETSFIDKFNKKTKYFKAYERPQKMVKGKYVGQFSCYCQYGKTCIKIIGEPGDLKIISNSRKIDEIINAMYIFTNRDFMYYKYKYAQNWSNSELWSTKIKTTTEVLISYGRNTCIKKSSAVNERGLDFEYNPNLKIPFFINDEHTDTYEIGENLRNIYITRGDSKVKIGSIRQNLSCPLSEYIELYPDYIEGFLNIDLLRTSVIFDMTVSREPQGNKAQYIELLQNNSEGVNAKPLIYLIYAMYANMDKNFDNVLDDNMLDQECIEIPLLGYKPMNEIMRIDSIDSSELIVEDIEMLDLLDNEGCLYKHKSIRKTICMKMSRPCTDSDKIDLCKQMLTNKKINEFVRSIGKNNVDDEREYLETLGQNLMGVTIPPEIYCYIVGNNLYSKESWRLLSDNSVRELLSSKKYTFNSVFCYNIGSLMCDIICEEVLGLAPEKVDDSIISLFK